MTERPSDIIYSLRPIENEDSRVLILGSIPGAESLRKQQYYANQRNHFWPIIYGIFGQNPDEDYERRKRFLLAKGIALWDVIEKCERSGSLDANIKNEQPNKIEELLNTHPEIRLVVFNGTKAYDIYRKKIGFEENTARIYKLLPSTSPIPGKNIKTFAEKFEVWKSIAEYLNG